MCARLDHLAFRWVTSSSSFYLPNKMCPSWRGQSCNSFLHFEIRKFCHSKSSRRIGMVNKLADGQLEDYIYNGRALRGWMQKFIVTVIPPTQEDAVLGSRKNTVRVRNIAQRVNSLCFSLRSLLFHTVHSKSDNCHTALLTFSLISHPFSLFSLSLSD